MKLAVNTTMALSLAMVLSAPALANEASQVLKWTGNLPGSGADGQHIRIRGEGPVGTTLTTGDVVVTSQGAVEGTYDISTRGAKFQVETFTSGDPSDNDNWAITSDYQLKFTSLEVLVGGVEDVLDTDDFTISAAGSDWTIGDVGDITASSVEVNVNAQGISYAGLTPYASIEINAAIMVGTTL
ncbi:hypothetical protein [Vibrio sp. WXL103]|uniref:hypothetical protein n=1 Tax=Vibrio sp. WXL103 TaxID=3450710 RepID=UPI003EC57E6B